LPCSETDGRDGCSSVELENFFGPGSHDDG
jgi:hypothetical protein